MRKYCDVYYDLLISGNNSGLFYLKKKKIGLHLSNNCDICFPSVHMQLSCPFGDVSVLQQDILHGSGSERFPGTNVGVSRMQNGEEYLLSTKFLVWVFTIRARIGQNELLVILDAVEKRKIVGHSGSPVMIH